jgi:peptide/nickel transport system substrate-binding protein
MRRIDAATMGVDPMSDAPEDLCLPRPGGISRRTLLKGSAAVAGTGALAASAGVTPFPVTSKASAQADTSTLVFLATDTAYSLDPAQNWDYGGGATILAHVYEGLFKFTGADQATIEPNLAAEVPSLENGGISADGLTYTIKLRPEAKFHDGSAVDATAIKYSYDRVKTLKLGVDFLFDQVDSVAVVDPATVKFTLKKPFSPFLYSVGSLWGNGIVNPAITEAHSTGASDMGLAYLQTADAGSGAYKLDSYDPAQKVATIVRDPNWWQGWGAGPFIEKAIIQWIAEPATVRSMLEQGDAQIVIGLTPEDWKAVSSEDGIVTSEHASSLQTLIYLNNKKAPFDNPKVREAIAWALDYDQIVNGIMGGHGVQLDSVVAKPYIGYAPASTKYTHDLDKAKAAIAASGLEEVSFDLYALSIFPNDQLILELLQADLQSIGVTMNVKTMDANAFLSQQNSGDIDKSFQGYLSNIGGDYPDAYELLALVYAENNQPPAFCCNSEFYGSDPMEQILTKVENALDPTERQAALQSGYDLAFTDLGVVWIHNFSQLVAMRSNVQGWDYNFMYGANYAPFEKMSLSSS